MSSHRGNPMELIDGQWIYIGSQKLVSAEHLNTPCGVCHEQYSKEGHDPCLGTLGGVMNACCGHGDVDQAYVQFADGEILRGSDAKDWQERSKTCQ